jgi:hypothetical protein
MTKTILAAALIGVFAVTAGLVAHYTESNDLNRGEIASAPPEPYTLGQEEQRQIHQSTGLTAYIDPETGNLVSQPAQSLTSGSATVGAVNLPPVKLTTHPNGMVQADLNGRFRIPLQVTVGCDGEIHKQHSSSEIPEATNCEAEK